jgi:ankyrin repeat protein
MLISDTAGMGKSTVLTHLSKEMKRKFPAKWVVRIDLNDHTDALEVLKSEQIDKQKVVEFISEKMLKLKPGLELELFKQSCNEKQKVRIIIMLDGFDEISPNYKQTVIDLLQALRQTAVEQLWVTTRPHLRNELEDKLQQLSYKLEHFSEENQVEFLRNFWCLQYYFIEASSVAAEKLKTKLELYAKYLIMKISQSISDKDREFTGIPLQCRMLAEAFVEKVQAFCQSTEFVPEFQLNLDLIGLYEMFLNRKYDICVEEKFKIPVTNVGADIVRKPLVETIRGQHTILALKMLFDEEELAYLHNNSQCTSSDEELTKTGIMQTGNEGNLNFIHRTFAEYYVADYCVKELIKGSNISKPIQELLLTKILLKKDYRVVRAFIDGLWSMSEPNNEVKKQCGNQINDIWKDGVLTLHTTAREGYSYIVRFLLDSLEETGHRDTLIKLLLAQDNNTHTAWYTAAKKDQLEVLQELWDWAEKLLTPDEIKYKLFLEECNRGRIAWHTAAEEGRLEVFHKLCDWAEQLLTPDEIKNKLFLAKNYLSRTAWYTAATNGQLKVLQKLYDLAEKVLTPDELKNILFLAKDNWNRTAWHAAAEESRLEVFHKLCDWAEKLLTPDEIKNIVFLAKGYGNTTAWHEAAKYGQLEVLQKLYDWAEKVLAPDELKNILFLAKDNWNRTAWHAAVENSRLEVFYKLCHWTEKLLTPDEIKNELFLPKGNSDWTAWHTAVTNSQLGVFHKLCDWAEKLLTPDEIKNKLFLAKNNLSRTAWYTAATNGQLEVLQKLYDWAEKVLTPDELKNILFLAKDKWNGTAWHAAAPTGQLEVLQKLYDWAEKVLTPDELKNTLFLAKDYWNRTAWHAAVEGNRLEVFHKLCDWAEKLLTPDEIKNKLFLEKDYWNRTAWHEAA